MHLSANTPPATQARSPQRTPTAPYSTTTTRRRTTTMTRGEKRTRKTWMRSSQKIATANSRTGPSTKPSCTPLNTSCCSMASSRPQSPLARGIWTGQWQGPWSTAGARPPRTTSHQAGPVLSAPRKDPSSQTATSTRQSPLRGIL